MFFADTITTGRLSEKPWKTDAIGRLIASVIVCVMIGAVAALVIQYFGSEQQKSLPIFIAGSFTALLCFAVSLFMLARPWPFEKFLRNLIILLICIYVGFFLIWAIGKLTGQNGELQNTTLRTLLGILFLHGTSFPLIYRFIREHGLRWNEAFGFKYKWAQALLAGGFVATLMVPVTWGILAGISTVLNRYNVQTADQLPVQMVKLAKTSLDWWLLGVATILIVPAAEEIAFRGILYPAIKRAGYPRVAVWGSAVAFAGIHLDLIRFLPLLVLALALVWLYEQTGNLLACIATHALFNAANFVALYLQQK